MRGSFDRNSQGDRYAANAKPSRAHRERFAIGTGTGLLLVVAEEAGAFASRGPGEIAGA
jgi:hypothetical protein